MASIFTSQTPVSTNLTDATEYTLGTTWYSTVAGSVSGIRWYFPTTLPTGTITALLYDYSTQALMGSTTFSAPTGGVWNTATFGAPIAVVANIPYIAAVHTNNRYVATDNFFTSAAVSNSPLFAPQDNSDPLGIGSLRNGRLNVGASPAYPGLTSGNQGCFFTDVVFDVPSTYVRPTIVVSRAAVHRASRW